MHFARLAQCLLEADNECDEFLKTFKYKELQQKLRRKNKKNRMNHIKIRLVVFPAIDYLQRGS